MITTAASLLLTTQDLTKSSSRSNSSSNFLSLAFSNPFQSLLPKKHAMSTMSISYNKLALLIGRKGGMLDEIREKTGVDVTVPRGTDESDRDVLLSATSMDNIEKVTCFYDDVKFC